MHIKEAPHLKNAEIIIFLFSDRKTLRKLAKKLKGADLPGETGKTNERKNEPQIKSNENKRYPGKCHYYCWFLCFILIYKY